MQGDPAFGQWVRRLRGAQDLTQEALAERLGCATDTIRKIEGGARRPSRETAARLAEILAVPTAQHEAFLRLARTLARFEPPGAVAQVVAGPAVATPADGPAPVAPFPTGTVTFLFSDIEGSTRLWERYPQAMALALARHDELIRQIIEAHGGLVFRTVGDAFCTAFASARAALAAAKAAQEAIYREAWGLSSPLRVRMALHTGSVDWHEGDYHGLPLSRIARILSAGHGGQLLLSRATHDLVADQLPPGADLRNLGEYRLRDLSRPEQIFQLVVAGLPSEFPPLRTPAPQRATLPIPPTTLVGRASELAELTGLMADEQCRLITLIGPGGVGKTRLALQIAVDLMASFADGVYFVSLASLPEASEAVPAIAAALGLLFSGSSDSTTQLLNYLQARHLLLVLDNLEHLIDGIRPLIEQLQRAPRLKLLLTSRERLRVQGEWVIELQGLQVAPRSSLKAIATSSAVTLFLDRARRLQRRFAVEEPDQRCVAHICQLLDGLPLGIELAASWVRVLSCGEIAQEIERNLDFLAALVPDLPLRHRSLRAVFDHSWNLLTAVERQAIRQLAVFRGGFGREAATQVARATLPLLASLVDKSLLRRTAAGRYDMHGLVWQYAALKLRDDPQEYAAACQRHCEYYALWVQGREQALKSARQRSTIAELSAEIDNLRAAWDWAGTNHDFAALGRMVDCVGYFYEVRCWFPEAESGTRQAVQALGAYLDELQARGGAADADQTTNFAHMLGAQGWFCFRVGQPQQALELLDRSLTLLRGLDDPMALYYTLVWLGFVAGLTGDPPTARLVLDEAIALAGSFRGDWYRALAMTILGMVGVIQGRYEEATQVLRESLRAWRAAGDPRGTVVCLSYLSAALLARGALAEAQQLARESLPLSSGLGDRWGLATALTRLGQVAHIQGEEGEALYLFHESLSLFQEIGDRWGMAETLTNLADTKAALGATREAWSTYRQAFAAAMEARTLPIALDALAGLATLLEATGDGAQVLELSAIILAHPASGQAASLRAAQLRASAAARVGHEVALLIEERARDRSLELVASSLTTPAECA